jgi:hypothetical protein
MTVQTIDNETVIRIPSKVKFDLLQSFLDYLTVKSILAQSQASEEEIEALAEQAQEDWWTANKSRFIK